MRIFVPYVAYDGHLHLERKFAFKIKHAKFKFENIHILFTVELLGTECRNC
jgi:hypothetical protein